MLVGMYQLIATLAMNRGILRSGCFADASI